MKKYFEFIFIVTSAFFASFFASFLVPLQSHKEREESSIKVAEFEPVAGKKAHVIESVSSNSGKVVFSSITCSARLSKKSTVKAIEPGAEVTIEYLENELLYVF